MKSTFKRNLIIGFGVSLLLLIVSSVASYTSISNLVGSERLVRHTNEIIFNLERILSTLKDAETGQRGYLLTNQDDFLDPYSGAKDTAINILERVKQATSDNPQQQQDMIALNDVIRNRLGILEDLIRKRKAGQVISTQELEKGKTFMDQARLIVNKMEDREQALLSERTARMKTFTSSTPILIITAALLSVIITIVFFLRVTADFENKTRLQQELETKDKQITARINIIDELAGKISKGDYKIRVGTEEEDMLGSLSGSLNKMAESLDYSFTSIEDREALQTGIVQLNEKMLGEQDIYSLTSSVIEFIADYTGSHTGAFYILNDKNKLEYSSGYAFDIPNDKKIIALGSGLAGQSALNGKKILIEDISQDDVLISYATGQVKPRSVLAVPVYFEGRVRGVFELGSLNRFTDNELAFLDAASQNIGVVLNTAENRRKLQELLEETQAQSEELQTQHTELENLNAELEAQAEKLQTSEEELKVQQEELLQANRELEDKSKTLEDKNQLIVDRNIEIQKKAEQLEISSRYKSEFLANMSHELRTPLNSILLLSRLLSENSGQNLSGEQVEYANVIRNSGNSLLSLIDEILDLSRIESGKMQLEYSEVSLSSLVSELNSMFMPLFTEKKLELKFTMQDNLPGVIETDRMRLEQILKNLLSNALKFTSRGYVHVGISLAADNMVRFSVKDTGIGVPQEKQQLIFEAFQQADGSTRRKFGGTGLGLSISRELVKLLGGTIDITSEAESGSEFVITIPVSLQVKQKRDADIKVEEQLVPAAGNGKTKPKLLFTSPVIPESIPDDRATIKDGDKVILIIEDDVPFAKSLLEFTRQKGYKGVVAVRGDEGLELAKRIKPSGILLDVQLPIKSGWEVIEELKEDISTSKIPVHMMSVYEVKKESISKGAIDFINKPVAFEKMQDVFKRIEYVLNKEPGKVLIVEDNGVHAKALAFFLQNFKVRVEVRHSVNEVIGTIGNKEVDCVILDTGIPDNLNYNTLEQIRKHPAFENIPVIVFTGKSLSQSEEMKIKQYADSIVVKTAHSYQRLLDEVSLFLHLVENEKTKQLVSQYRKTGSLTEVLRGKTVLIADDDARNIFALTGTLEQLGMNIVTAIDGRDALKQLGEHPQTDVVLMDMMMPEMDGYATIAAIRRNPLYRKLPILAVTAKAMSGDREKCIEAGASDYISKPVDVDQLLSLLRVWLYGK
jgi:signal transduction histidine kinase/DNA-binding response OmpR family regulator/CHASE3 domain sensor protein